MRLYLVQHGEATSKDINPDRPLTEKGKADSQKTAAFLKKAGIPVNSIWHSTKTRAIETASIFARDLSVERVEQRDGLAPNDPVDNVFSGIANIEDDIMIVGHLPFLQKLASLLLTGSESNCIVRFNMAGCVCLEKVESSKWVLVFAIVPDLLQ
jgi:phosphohistidine phosphatase